MTIDRRAFLKSTGVALAASAIPVRGKSAAPALSTLEIKKAIKIGMAPRDLPITERFKLIKACGFDGVDMDSPGAYDRDEVLRARDASGLEIHGCVCSTHWKDPLSSPDPEVRGRTVEAMRTAMDDCKAWGGTTVLLVPAVVSAEISYDQAYERSVAEIKRLLDHAESTGITIAFENVWNNFLLSPLEFAEYIDAFESEKVKAYFDIGNVVRFGWPEQWVRILGDRIIKLDVKEYSRDKQQNEGIYKGFDVKLGEGSVDWAAVRDAIAEIGYSGYATAEVSGGDEEYLRDLSRRMDECFGLA